MGVNQVPRTGYGNAERDEGGRLVDEVRRVGAEDMAAQDKPVLPHQEFTQSVGVLPRSARPSQAPAR